MTGRYQFVEKVDSVQFIVDSFGVRPPREGRAQLNSRKRSPSSISCFGGRIQISRREAAHLNRQLYTINCQPYTVNFFYIINRKVSRIGVYIKSEGGVSRDTPPRYIVTPPNARCEYTKHTGSEAAAGNQWKEKAKLHDQKA